MFHLFDTLIFSQRNLSLRQLLQLSIEHFIDHFLQLLVLLFFNILLLFFFITFFLNLFIDHLILFGSFFYFLWRTTEFKIIPKGMKYDMQDKIIIIIILSIHSHAIPNDTIVCIFLCHTKTETNFDTFCPAILKFSIIRGI